LLLLTGCSGIKNIQDLTYIVGIGMDYDEEKKEFTSYLQGLNFANVAKQEGSKPIEPIPIFIASATGETLNLAVSKLYSKSEPSLFFGHVETIVLSQSIVKHKFKEVMKEIGRNRSLRHTMRVVTTEEKIEDIFNIRALFNYPAVYTVIYKTGQNELFENELKPISLMMFLREYYEPMGTAKIPSVKIDQDSWTEDKKFPVLYFDGFNIFQHQEYMNKLRFKDSVFINWLLEKSVSLDHRVEEEGKLVAAVKLATPKMKVKYEKGTKLPKVSLEISAKADLLEKIDEDLPLKTLKKIIEDDLKKRVLNIYKDGVDKKSDILNIGEKWYRKHPKEYHDLKNSNSFYLTEDSLKNVKVSVEIFHFNSYKYHMRGNRDF
jgi:spore germination protein KC